MLNTPRIDHALLEMKREWVKSHGYTLNSVQYTELLDELEQLPKRLDVNLSVRYFNGAYRIDEFSIQIPHAWAPEPKPVSRVLVKGEDGKLIGEVVPDDINDDELLDD